MYYMLLMNGVVYRTDQLLPSEYLQIRVLVKIIYNYNSNSN